MKIVNNEGNIEVIYVQNKDIIQVIHNCESIPSALLDECFEELVVIRESNINDFVRLSNRSLITYFENIDWILNYREVKGLSDDEIVEFEIKIVDELKQLQDDINNSYDNDKIKKLVNRQIQLKYKLDTLRELRRYKKGYLKYNFPIVSDSDGFFISNVNNSGYNISSSLDSKKLLLYRKDGKPLSRNDKIPKELIQKGMSIAIVGNNEDPSFYEDYEIENSLSSDKKYMVIDFNTKNKKEEQENKTSEVGLKKMMQRIFKKRK